MMSPPPDLNCCTWNVWGTPGGNVWGLDSYLFIKITGVVGTAESAKNMAGDGEDLLGAQ